MLIGIGNHNHLNSSQSAFGNQKSTLTNLSIGSHHTTDATASASPGHGVANVSLQQTTSPQFANP